MGWWNDVTDAVSDAADFVKDTASDAAKEVGEFVGDNPYVLLPFGPSVVAAAWLTDYAFDSAWDKNKKEQKQIELQKDLSTINYNEAVVKIDTAWENLLRDYDTKTTAIEQEILDNQETFDQYSDQISTNADSTRSLVTDKFQTDAESKRTQIDAANDQISDLEREKRKEASTGVASAGASGTRLTGNTKSTIQQREEEAQTVIDRERTSVGDELTIFNKEGENYFTAADQTRDKEYQRIESAQTQLTQEEDKLRAVLGSMEEIKEDRYEELYGDEGAKSFLTQKYKTGQEIFNNEIDFLQDNIWMDSFSAAFEMASFTIDIVSLFGGI